MEFLSNNKTSNSSTTRFVDIKSLEDGVVRLKNGSLRSVLLVSSINFDLKSSDEQDAIIVAYQNFLNSLDFPVQIIINSRKLNIAPYINKVTRSAKTQHNELLRLQTIEYKNFIESLTTRINIMSKFFYIVVPFSPIEKAGGGILDKISSAFGKNSKARQLELYETNKNQLWQRVDHVAAALSGTGLHFTALNTEELIELFYNSYNPSAFVKKALKNLDKVELTKL